MSEELDNDLKNRIRDMFDNYEDDTADAGWELLRQKFPEEEKKRRVIAWWWYPAAAVLLLCLGTWFFYPQASQQVAYQAKKTNSGTNQTGTNSNEAIAVNKTPSGIQSKPSSTPHTVVSSENAQQANAIVGTSTEKNKIASTTLSAPNATSLSSQPSQLKELVATQLVAGANVHTKSYNSKTTQQPKTIDETTGLTAIAKQPGITTTSSSGSIANLLANSTSPSVIKTKQAGAVSSTNNTEEESITDNNTAKVAAVQTPANTAQPASTQTKTDAVLKMIAADDARRAVIAKNAVKKNETVKSDRAMVLSLYAATYFNYAKGSQNQLNVGGGFTSDIRLTGNLKLSTGVSIGQNRLSYADAGDIPQQANSRILATTADASAKSYNLVASSLRSAGPQVESYNASLVGLDIPLNIKYQFNPKKSDTYISAGISSGTYINETYRSTYSYSNSYYNVAAASAVPTLNAVSAAAQQSQESTSTSHFGSFDFAKTLNLSFGLGYPLGKNRLVIEPFLKYPLNGLGAQDIKFGASGVNLKLSFSTSKK